MLRDSYLLKKVLGCIGLQTKKMASKKITPKNIPGMSFGDLLLE